MDRNWMNANRLLAEYKQGVDHFLDFCQKYAKNPKLVLCPCLECGNLDRMNITEIKEHLLRNGIDKSYKVWVYHGEKKIRVPGEGTSKSKKVKGVNLGYEDDCIPEMIGDAQFESNADLLKFQSFVEDAEKPIYPNCNRFTKLSTLVRLYNIKAKHGWSDKSFTDLLTFLVELLPEGNVMPLSFYEAKKTLSSLGMQYEKIHACPNDCILYRKGLVDAVLCPTCGESRWQKKKNSDEVKVGVPAKVLWYLPPIPRLVRFFRNVNHAKNLTWHASDRILDGKMRHRADSPTWKSIDARWPEFGNEPRNIRLGLSIDGINPHTTLNSKYSCWPVLLVMYNLPPWLVMKRKFTMLTLLISGPSQPGNDIDVYLAPLVDDLSQLWYEGVPAYDAFRKEEFNLKAILLWTINDFPAFGNLSGYSVKGDKACPICEEKTCSMYLKHSKKMCYMGHRKFLPKEHVFRTWKKAFNGKQEFELPPPPLQGEQVFEKLNKVQFHLGKRKMTSKKRKGRREKSDVTNEPQGPWKKKSIFFELEYWKHLFVPHNLDVMHIEKNVSNNLLNTLFNIPGRSKDGIKSRLDLKELGIRTNLHPQVVGGRTFLPPACHALTKVEKQSFCSSISHVKLPEGYSSNVSDWVDTNKLSLSGLKSHDHHMLIQHILPVSIRSVLPKKVRYAITRLCLFFKSLCCKVVDVPKLMNLRSEIIEVLCYLEQFFPPSFFDITVHLTVHLVREVKLCGPVYLRWMYPFERYMKMLKGYARNKSRPEGCIVESYIVEETIEFCSDYMSEVTTGSRPTRVDIGTSRENRGVSVCGVSRADREEAHRLVLLNIDEVQPYIEEHFNWIKTTTPTKAMNQKWIQDEHYRNFNTWFKKKVYVEMCESPSNVSNTLLCISRGPSCDVLKYQSYYINSTQFCTQNHDKCKKTQNSGVTIVAKTFQLSSSKDKNSNECDMSFYGVIQEIWELDYNSFRIPVFLCDWVRSDNGVKDDEFGFKLVDLNRIGHKFNRFIMASQATQVFYMSDPLDARWSVVLTTQPKDYANQESSDDDLMLSDQIYQITPPLIDFTVEDDIISSRDDGEGLWVNEPINT
ncbi:uncharacterized protein LOC133033034 [Cannabis sativa]|uniref:uncharacterized protein LOC133033034 n=1 Tax=Cannabis sativa TaxID=3483 RepID=UPI0029CA1DBC|nr:uncharacterized protein LOC133033034 [Cannabis sativa]XP_060963549.1 uncharacterized protein LOC133033034 [Cannabis sativa]XP_060963550.1 uncharacterized protein LOC133033034 [Cannabis sativa]XP_060963551.1 uncharacterized protein LOC133033034 [Cannabis sativa]